MAQHLWDAGVGSAVREDQARSRSKLLHWGLQSLETKETSLGKEGLPVGRPQYLLINFSQVHLSSEGTQGQDPKDPGTNSS